MWTTGLNDTHWIVPGTVIDAKDRGMTWMEIHDWLLDRTDWATLTRISRCAESEQMVPRWTGSQSPLVQRYTRRGIYYVCKKHTEDTHQIIPWWWRQIGLLNGLVPFWRSLSLEKILLQGDNSPSNSNKPTDIIDSKSHFLSLFHKDSLLSLKVTAKLFLFRKTTCTLKSCLVLSVCKI